MKMEHAIRAGANALIKWTLRTTAILFFTAIMIAPAVVTIIGCKDTPRPETVKRPEISHVTVSAVSTSTVDDIHEVTGTVRSDRSSNVAARAMGVVTSVLVREGDGVRAGQTLLTIDDRVALQQVRAADMALESAKQNAVLADATWRRYKNLYDEKALSRQEMDQMETRKKVAAAEYERAKAMVDEARTHLSFTRVTAPVAGVITQKNIEVGNMAAPGVPLLTIEGGGGAYIEAAIDANLSDKIIKGMAVDAVIETRKPHLRGVVREVLPAVDPQSRTFTVKVGLADSRIRSGLFARLRIPIGQKKVILVPERAIVQKGQLTGVYAVDQMGVITYRLVRTGQTSVDKTEILSGLTAHDRIVTDGVERVQDGGIIKGVNAQ